MVDMNELEYRANINVYDVDMGEIHKPVIVYDDHRTILNVLFFARMRGILKQAPNLIFFDWHDDACVRIRKRMLSANKPKRFTEKEYERFWRFVEFKCSPNDDDWLSSGMYFDLIKHAVRVGGEESSNIETLNEFFKHKQHHMYAISHFDFETKSQGCFENRFSQKPEDNSHIRSIFDMRWNTDEDVENDVPLVLDFDLDCFTGSVGDTRIAWPEQVFYRRYVENRYAYNLLYRTALRAEFITICREPYYCGGIGEANKIISYLDKYLFDGQLHTQSVL